MPPSPRVYASRRIGLMAIAVAALAVLGSVFVIAQTRNETETAEVKGLIDRAEAALRAGRTASDLLTDAAYLPAREWPRFRNLLRTHVTAGVVKLVPESEPGVRLHVRGTVRGADGRPVAGALLYVYHTNSKGYYGNDSDTRNARLFAYLKTDTNGGYAFHTIRPAGYPKSDLPAHIHVLIEAPGQPPRPHDTEVVFDDDPRLTPTWRERAREAGFVIAPVQRDNDGVQSVVADLTLR